MAEDTCRAQRNPAMKTLPNASELLETTKKLSTEVLAKNADESDRQRTFPRVNIERLGEAGLFGLLVPSQYGGAGGGISEMAQALEQMAQACASTAMIMLMHFCGTAVIVAKASDKLKSELLPQIAAGKHLTTLAFSEAGSGGHFYTPVSEPKPNGRAVRLSARKSFVTSANEADSYIVSTRRPGASGPTDLNLYLVKNGANGFSVERKFEGLGLTANDSAAMRMDDVELSDDNRLGEPGTGFQTMLEVVLPHFQIGSAAVSLGIAGAAFAAATAHVSERKYEQAGGAALSAIPRVQYLEAEMALELRAARAYLENAINKATSGHPEAMLDILAVKIKAADAALAVSSKAMTLGGGAAFGRRGGLERIFRDAQAASVMAPASDVLKDFLGKAVLGLPLF
jgi:alkylation response protein AidB-like acyl-CoA dehydrogenase